MRNGQHQSRKPISARSIRYSQPYRPDGADLTVATGQCCPVGVELRGTKAAALAACARNIHMPLIFSL
jgi:hypothetical protein